jgi:hypothetical protein
MTEFTLIFIKLPSQTLEFVLSSRENYSRIRAHSGNKHRLTALSLSNGARILEALQTEEARIT